VTLKSRFGVTQDYWKWQLSIYIAYEFLFVFLQCTVRCLVSMHKRGLCRHAVCVCVSVTFVDSVEMSNRIVRLFSQSGSGRPIILVFPHQTGWQYSDGNPLTRASNAGGVGKKRDSGRISVFAAYRSTSSARVANCEKQSRDERRQASSTPRRPSSVVRTRRRRSVCDGLNVIRRGKEVKLPPGHNPLVVTPVFCCCRTL